MKRFLLIAFLLSLFQSCGICDCKKVACPAFSDTVFPAWFPYTKGQTLIFKNASQQTDTILINYLNKNEAYEAQKGCYGGSSGCEQYINLRQVDSTGMQPERFGISFNKQTAFTSNAFSNHLQIFVRGFSITGSLSSDSILQDNSSIGISTKYHPSLQLGVQTYTAVQVFNTDTALVKNTGIYKLYISKNAGIAGYETYPGGVLWVLQ
ncbi:MAG: hypothetical protein SFU21_04215 [Flavihumibacter sp.]|nr:hypothetical protein [Flavihumibacter sp.]